MKHHQLRILLASWLVATASSPATVLYVDVNSANPTPPYTNWATAATNIQDAVDAANAGDEVVVTNGVYSTGGRRVPESSLAGEITNRVAVMNALTLRSVNGPQFTVIQGYQGTPGIRCAYLTNGAVLSGFTLTNGGTISGVVYGAAESGGGVLCESAGGFSTNCVITNCVITGNYAGNTGGGVVGGGVAGGSLFNCTVAGNSADGAGGGVAVGNLFNCTLTGNSTGQFGYGGGAYNCSLNDCTVSSNSAGSLGGGAYGGILNNCTLTGNSASTGGGASDGNLNHCTLISNSAGSGGGASGGTLNDCTVAGNSATQGGGASGSTLNNCTLIGNSAGSGGGASGGILNNCTLTGNSASSGGGASGGTLNDCTVAGNSATQGGGGAWNAVLNNCVVSSNSVTAAYSNGGGVSGCTLNNCALFGNTAKGDGGGAYSGTLNNCTVTGNSAGTGGGVAGGQYGSCALTNCIVYFNQARVFGDNFDLSTALNFCCTTPLPFSGTGNLAAEPLLAGNWHLSPDSPCRGAGTAVSATGLDLDGETWANQPSIGCDEYHSGSVTGGVTVAVLAAYTNVATGFAVDFQELISGRVSASRWEFGDGTVVSNRPYAVHAWNAAGDYPVVLRAYNESYPAGVAATVTVHVVTQQVHYVALNSPGPTPPYSTWLTAATNIQDAVDVATMPGALVWVSNGVYETGITVVSGASNRVAVTKPVRVESVNGPGMTIIVGSGSPSPETVRCVYLAGGAMITGFTLTNGATQTLPFDEQQHSGGGIYCEWPSAVVSNCVLTGNRAYAGGGAAGGTLNNCTLIGNGVGAYQSGGGAFGSRLKYCTLTSNGASWGGGASECTLDNCVLIGNRGADAIFFPTPFAGYGGGTDLSTLDHCLVISNTAASGGGVSYSQLRNCTLAGNSATGLFPFNGGFGGGGALEGTLVNCTIAGNSAPVGGGVNGSTLRSSIVYFNNSPDGPDYGLAFSPHVSALDYCCTTRMPTNGVGNITNAPLFVDTNDWANLRLQSNSPCINTGNNAYAVGSTDLDGRPRILGGTVDIGAYESQPGVSGEFIGWLSEYGLPSDGSADYAHSDIDPYNNWQEWIAGTIPTDALSALRLLNPADDASGITVSWQSVSNRTYFLERATNFGAASPFVLLQSNISGQADTTSYTDTNAAGPGPFFYRVGVQQ